MADVTTQSMPPPPGTADRRHVAVEDEVNKQYDTDASMAFYEHVMGGGGDDIHYGLFLAPGDGLRQSSQNSVEMLASMAEACGALAKGKKSETPVRVLDLGSGKGGAARWLAKTYGCHVTCFNLGQKQNEFNKAKAVSDGIGALIHTHLGSFNEPLPLDWTDSFDLVWSQEAFCHSVDQQGLIDEVQRVLKPGGTVVFSDIMQGDAGGDCSSFTGQNVTTKLATPQSYKDAIKGAGMQLAEHRDFTQHLTPYFKCMLEAVKESKLPLQLKGVSMARLDAYEEDLVTRFDAVKQRAFAWGMFAARNLFSSDPLLSGSAAGEGQCPDQLAECINAQYDSEASMNFYKHTMGGGTDYVHYGVFSTPEDTLSTAAHNTVELLSELIRRVSRLGLGMGACVRVLDLGSGKGATARHLAGHFGCHVTCFNLGENQNAHCVAEARAAGVGHLVECVRGNFNAGLPADWTASFDIVWSQEALCHAQDQRAVLREVMRVLKPGGAAIFTDIMRNQSASSMNLCGAITDSDLGSPVHPSRADSPVPLVVVSEGTPPSRGKVSDDGGPSSDSSSPSQSATTAAIPIQRRASRALRHSTSTATIGGQAASFGTSLLASSAPHDFSTGAKPANALDGRLLHASSPGLYARNIADAGLRLVDYRDLSEHLAPFYRGMLEELESNEDELVAAGIPSARLAATCVDLRARLAAADSHTLAWGAFTARKPAHSRAMVVGGGPLGAAVAMRLSQSGIADITLKVLPATSPSVLEMAGLAGIATVEEWEDVRATHWGVVWIAIKTHWLPQVALEMEGNEVTFDNLCMAYNGYTQTPAYFCSPKCCRAVVPQSFSFDHDAMITWDVKHGNTQNPWTLPMGKVSSSIVGQLRQSGVAAACDQHFHSKAFFKFCVNNAANLLAVIEDKCCADLVGDRGCMATMRALLHETFDVLELDPFYVALVPMHRAAFIEQVLLTGKGSVASYAGHFPSSHQHYKAGKLVDARALNGFVVRKAREVGLPAPLNEYVARRVVAIVAATSSGVPRGEWDLRVKLSAAKRMIDRAGMGVSVWGHASVRCPQDASRMLIAPFGESFSHATASGLESRPLHPGALDAAEAAATNVTAVVLHGAVYAARPDARCVLHTHSPHCTAVAAADLRLDAAITQDAMQFLGRVAYHDFQGVADEAEEMAAVAEAARGADALFLRNHGVIIVGEDVERAYSRLFYLERCCQTQLLVSGTGAAVAKADPRGVQHTADWYRTDGEASAHAEWAAHMKDLLHTEAAAPRTKQFWYE